MIQGDVVAETRCGVVRVTETRYARGAVLAHHRHVEPYVSILVEGDYTEIRNGSPQRCGHGTVLVHACNEEHADYFSTSGRCLNIELLDPSYRASEWIRSERVLAAGRRLKSLAEQVAILHARTGLRHCGPLERLIGELLVAVSSGDDDPNPSMPMWLRKALDEFTWTEAKPLARIARGVGIHPTHFSRAFRQHMGQTPNEYRRSTRVREASKLLLQSQLGLAEVAQATGFHDQSHLTNVFFAQAGISPARYRSLFRR